MTDFIWIVIALPLLGAVVLHFFGRRFGEPRAGLIGFGMVGASFVIAAVAAIPFFRGESHGEHVFLFEWIEGLGAAASLLWDPLSAVLTLVITGIGALIHLYSIGYMHGDPRFSRFFTYLNLFIASMLILVLGDNFGMLFVGWELVGLCSYLLISFWNEKPSAAAAGKKAFVVNRIGDVGFLIALMLIFTTFGTLAFEEVLNIEAWEEHGIELSVGLATAITLLLLVGGTGKSAQLPLFMWLPDAMEGPTPVSALIHAATMVTAGVYMIARTAVLFEMAPVSSAIVASVGAVTALFAASIALKQRDIKRVLAYSTISQLGYMFLAVGVGAYVAGIFHLFTHAFFKALLFLGSGAVIHAMADEQDIGRMGGLRKAMPITHLTQVVGWLAIIGIFPFAGFWSKDEILAVTFGKGGGYYVLWAIGLLTALLTAVYMTRWIALTFWGKARFGEDVHPHEAPGSMVLPLVVLAAFSFGVGFWNTPFLPSLEHFLEPAFEGVEQAHLPEGLVPWVLAVISVGVAVVGAFYAFRRYRGENAVELSPIGKGSWSLVEQAYHVDDLVGRWLVAPGRAISNFLAFVVDRDVIDGAVNGLATAVKAAGERLRPLQSGFVRQYGLGLVAGTVGLLVWFASRGLT
ncbi:MAG: NADH-quinone oxidoreductase subunit L [Acidimicrobiia bacterium]|nr:NADH-quinone oxidoreductase subunit L [Acidimicrobiia bacterium]NNC42132.1 NADH-quinone oxidoreductase subunit L [Acidimicrobiia bacterium]NNL28073.1 NADH-quinone oxidoreductase subunit L [Acidimicrobiia bacterium]